MWIVYGSRILLGDVLPVRMSAASDLTMSFTLYSSLKRLGMMRSKLGSKALPHSRAPSLKASNADVTTCTVVQITKDTLLLCTSLCLFVCQQVSRTVSKMVSQFSSASQAAACSYQVTAVVHDICSTDIK